MEQLSTDELVLKMNRYKEEYYKNNSKNTIFKNKQKMELAKKISENFNMNELLQLTSYIIPNTPHIYFDYTVFKLYANESNYNEIARFVLNQFDTCIQNYGEYIVHVNLDSFTVSAAERYKRLVEIVNSLCIQNVNVNYTQRLRAWYIYNPPNVLDMIHKILKTVLDKGAVAKLNVVSKKDSPEILSKILNVGKIVLIEHGEENDEDNVTDPESNHSI
jgi:hypothetical protein